VSSEIVNHTFKTIGAGLDLLEYCAIEHIKEEGGKQMSDNSKIIDVYDLKQVNEPVVDCILIYRTANHPHSLNIYQRKTIVTTINGYVWGSSNTTMPTFKRTHIFELEQYNKLGSSSVHNNYSVSNSECENEHFVPMVPIGPARVMVPKPLTVAPMCDLLNELKKCARFKDRFKEVNSYITSSPKSVRKIQTPDFSLDGNRKKIVEKITVDSSAVLNTEISSQIVEPTIISDEDLKELSELDLPPLEDESEGFMMEEVN